MKLVHAVLYTSVAFGLVACGGGESSSIDNTLKQVVNEHPLSDLNALTQLSSNNQRVTSDSYIDYPYNTDKPFENTSDYAVDNIVKTYHYRWSDSPLSSAHQTSHALDLVINNIDDASAMLRDSMKGNTLMDPESVIKKNVLANLILPITTSRLDYIRTYNDLLTEDVMALGRPYCQYQKAQSPRTDYSMDCTLPASQTLFGKTVEVSMIQVDQVPSVYTTNDNRTYAVHRFEQQVDVINSDGTPSQTFTPADVLVHPGLGIVAVELGGLGPIRVENLGWAWQTQNANADI